MLRLAACKGSEVQACWFLPSSPAQYEDIKDAIKALEATNGKQLQGRTITVEYVQNENPFGKDDDGPRGGGRSRSPAPRSRGGRSRSRTPPRRR